MVKGKYNSSASASLKQVIGAAKNSKPGTTLGDRVDKIMKTNSRLSRQSDPNTTGRWKTAARSYAMDPNTTGKWKAAARDTQAGQWRMAADTQQGHWKTKSKNWGM